METNAKSSNHKFLLNINEFEKIESLDNGTYGTVFIAKNKITNELFAAKVLVKQKSQKLYSKLVKREIENMIRCQHPTIVKFVGYTTNDFDNQNYVTIFMRLEEKSLRRALDESKKIKNKESKCTLNNTQRQIILIGIAKGMWIIHQHHIIHRDLKPGNVLLDKNMHPRITDFGLSKFISVKELNQASMNTGTPIYNSPEIFTNSDYTEKTDVYSFGIMMYEIVTNSNPFSKMKAYTIFREVVEKNNRPIFNTPVKEGIKELIMQCWDKDPEARPSFEEIFNKLAYNIDEKSTFKISVKETLKEIIQECCDKSSEQKSSFNESLKNLILSNDNNDQPQEKITESSVNNFDDDDDDDDDNDDEENDLDIYTENNYKYYLDGIDIGEVIGYANSIDGNNIPITGISELIDEKFSNIGSNENLQKIGSQASFNEAIDKSSIENSQSKATLDDTIRRLIEPLQEENKKLKKEKTLLEQKVQTLSDEIEPLKSSNLQLQNQMKDIRAFLETFRSRNQMQPPPEESTVISPEKIKS